MKSEHGVRGRLTQKQAAILQFIRLYLQDNQLPPSYRDIGDHFGVSVGTIQDQIEALHKKGFLEKLEFIARGIKVMGGINSIPVLGRVHAGPLHAAIEDVEGYVQADARLSGDRHFALRVRGDSMIGAGIYEGDTILVRSQPTANKGDIVVARIGDETTVKRLSDVSGRPVLMPENDRYQPITEAFEIVGVVIELRRRISK